MLFGWIRHFHEASVVDDRWWKIEEQQCVCPGFAV